MAVENERKFLVEGQFTRPPESEGTLIVQGYLCSTGAAEVRVRMKGADAYLTIKSSRQGITRAEFEYPIPRPDAEEILRDLCALPTIHKRRYVLTEDGVNWEIDIFSGANEGLVLAEVELSDVHADLKKPHWLGREVTNDQRFRNASLAKNPYSKWHHT